jgi:adenylate kinase
LVKERLKAPDCARGYLFDGFPRTIVQADALKDAHVGIDVVLEIDVPYADIIQRMSGRRIHQPSGRSYHTLFNPPTVEGLDDETGEALIQREDDHEDTVRKRLDVYEAQTRPLVEYYAAWAQQSPATAPRYCKISGLGSVEEIRQRVFASLQSSETPIQQF